MTTETIEFTTYTISVAEIFERLSAGQIISGPQRILIKPNLVTDSPYPVTTPPVGKLVAGYDPTEVDRVSAGLLGLDWNKIRHLQ
ncbi:MAG: hypothetical protein ACLFNW_08425 [Desulfobacterales bacterium]